MKKAVFLIAVLVGFSTMAQDTITDLPSNYFYNDWIGDGQQLSVSGWGNNTNTGCGELIKGFYVSDSITIYGVAAALWCPAYQDDWWREDSLNEYIVTLNYDDTTAEGSFEFVQLLDYNPDSHSVSVIEQKKVHVKYSPIRHWMHTQPITGYPTYREYLPIYEVYFSKPYVFYDTFYVGVTQLTKEKLDNGKWRTFHFEAMVLYELPIDLQLLHTTNCMWYISGDSLDSAITYHIGPSPYKLYFPILTPSPYPEDYIDTADVDTVSIQIATDEADFTLAPNPATGRVTATLPQGTRSLIVHAADGRTVYQRKVECGERSVEIDVSRWAKGVYTVTIETGRGTAARKLVVE